MADLFIDFPNVLQVAETALADEWVRNGERLSLQKRVLRLGKKALPGWLMLLVFGVLASRPNKAYTKLINSLRLTRPCLITPLELHLA